MQAKKGLKKADVSRASETRHDRALAKVMRSPFHVNERVAIGATDSHFLYFTRIIRFKPNDCIIVEHPPIFDIRIGDDVQVRSLEQEGAFLNTRIRDIVEDLALLVLAFPTVAPERSLRASKDGDKLARSPRKKVFLLGRCDHPGAESPFWEGYVINISESGCLLLGELTALIDHTVIFSFRVPWTGEWLRSEARVVRSEISEQGVFSALKFIRLDSRVKSSIQTFIASLENPPAPPV